MQFIKKLIVLTKLRKPEQASASERQEPKATKTKSIGDKIFTKAGVLSAPLFAFLAERQLLSYLGNLTRSPATIYDKALDAEYLRTHIGGADHRLFDGGHSIFAAWEKVRNASPDDSFRQEVVGYVSALWKDLTTVKGLPYMTVDKGKFETWVEALQWIPGVDREYVYKLFSFDAIRVFSTALGVVFALFALKKEDQKMLAEILASMGIIAIISANPLMGILVICTAGYAYKKKKMQFDKAAFGKASIMTVGCVAIFKALKLPLLVEVIIITVISILLKKYVLDNERLHAFSKSHLKSLRKETLALSACVVKSTSYFFTNCSTITLIACAVKSVKPSASPISYLPLMTDNDAFSVYCQGCFVSNV